MIYWWANTPEYSQNAFSKCAANDLANVSENIGRTVV